MSRPKATPARPASHDAQPHKTQSHKTQPHDDQAHDDLRRKYAEIHRRLNLMAVLGGDAPVRD